MNLKDIFFHDCTLVRVVELPGRDLMCEVDYPIDWEANVFGPKTILFSDVSRYAVDEGPFLGAPVLLEYSAEEDGDRTRITLRTNAGTRSLSFKSVELIDGHNATGFAG
jgi:hypothetical protein